MDRVTNSVDILDGLTESQREAVRHVEGPLLVLAGPGSGKTRVITSRVAYLIQQGVSPRHILAITFTNKAAEEMRSRLQAMYIPRGVTICTFHSLAARLLREFSDYTGLPHDFSIYDDADQKAAIREAMKTCELDAGNFPVGSVLYRISSYKNDLKTPEDIAKNPADFLDKKTAGIYAAYQACLQKNGAADFDDLLMKLAFLLRDHPPIREQLNDRYRFVLVDEYQDTNHCQYLIAHGLALKHGNLCVTGDPDQSIYGWRGANISNILDFEKDYPNARIVRLEENFRSTPEVLELANELIEKNFKRKEKRLYTRNPHGILPQLTAYGDEHQEAVGLVQWIRTLWEKGTPYHEMAVFYRVNSMSRVLEEALRRGTVPYQIVRGVEFYQRKEIKDMLAYLRLILNPSDQISLKRIINEPARGIGKTTVDRLLEYALRYSKEMAYVLAHLEEVGELSAGAKNKVAGFVRMIDQFRQNASGSVEAVLRMVYHQSGLADALQQEKNEDAAENVEELISSAAEYDGQTETPSLADYLHQVSLVSDTDAMDSQSGCVSLMTLHAAKGLEFDAVRIVGVEEGLIPHSRSLGGDDDKEEERRLLFVGITRARKILHLSYAENRMFQGITSACICSSFLRGLSGLNAQIEEEEMHPVSRKHAETSAWDFPDDESQDELEEKFLPGQLVRHPQFGLGRVEQFQPAGENSKIIIRFNSGPKKTLYLKYANLRKVGFGD